MKNKDTFVSASTISMTISLIKLLACFSLLQTALLQHSTNDSS